MITAKNAPQTVMIAFSEEQFDHFQNTLLRIEDVLNKKEKTEEGFLTVEKVTELFYCSRSTIYNWQKKGYITSQVVGGRVYFKKSECLKAFETAPRKGKGGKKNG